MGGSGCSPLSQNPSRAANGSVSFGRDVRGPLHLFMPLYWSRGKNQRIFILKKGVYEPAGVQRKGSVGSLGLGLGR